MKDIEAKINIKTIKKWVNIRIYADDLPEFLDIIKDSGVVAFINAATTHFYPKQDETIDEETDDIDDGNQSSDKESIAADSGHRSKNKRDRKNKK